RGGMRDIAIERFDLVLAVLTRAQAPVLIVAAQAAAAEFQVLAGLRIFRVERQQAERETVLPVAVLAKEFVIVIAAGMQEPELQQAPPGPVATPVRLRIVVTQRRIRIQRAAWRAHHARVQPGESARIGPQQWRPAGRIECIPVLKVADPRAIARIGVHRSSRQTRADGDGQRSKFAQRSHAHRYSWNLEPDGLLEPWMLVWQERHARPISRSSGVGPLASPATVCRSLGCPVMVWHCWHSIGTGSTSSVWLLEPCGSWQVRQFSRTGACSNTNGPRFSAWQV